MKMSQLESTAYEGLTSPPSEQALALCAQAKEREEAGEFEEARLALIELWPRIGERPRVEGLEGSAPAELLLRAGTLSGWIGSARQFPGAQEIAKDLISESSARFEELGLTEKVVEAQVDLGICYWREGALDEARITYDDALERLGDLVSEQKLRAVLNKAVVEESATRPQEALGLLVGAEALFDTSSNYSLKGKFHNVFATVLKNVGLARRREDYIDRALMQYTAASVNFEKAGHKRFLAAVENNLGFLFVHLERFEEAHAHLDRARSMLTNLKDKGFVAQVDDTRARAFLGQRRPEQAERIARAAVKNLREGGQQSNLVVALTTQATALARIDRHSDALAMLNEAVNMATQAGDPETGGIASITIIEELSSRLSPAELENHYQSAESALRHSQHAAIRFRLGECARTVLAAEALSTTPSAAGTAPAEVSTHTSLEEQVLRYEGELIRRALQASEGSVTRAARLLGITHQGLAFILNGRQKNLLPARKPVKPRRRSIIRYH
jgi:tetratricopeptide (TPR) repeat protein